MTELNTKTLDIIKTLIRYDVPILLLGVSSIGKSRTILSLAKKYRVGHQLLYIGSEKPENIEGLPKLHSETQGLEYFKPYWFPKADDINKAVIAGRNMFNEFIKNIPEFEYTFTKLNAILDGFSNLEWKQTQTEQEATIEDYSKSTYDTHVYFNEKNPIKLTREIPKVGYYNDDIRNICSYVSTLLGYGNFWLILDEIDKVEEFDIDKYAPLLHITRERYLKGWNLVEVNDKKGINIPSMVKGGQYDVIKMIIDNTIAQGQSLLDTRIIAIANKTSNIEEALFRRFVQIIIQDMLVLDTRDITPEMSNLKSCLQSTMGDALAIPPLKKLSEVNLQWVFDFFVRMINKNDREGNSFYKDALIAVSSVREPKNSDSYKAEKNKALRTTSLYKVVVDNFEDEHQNAILECLTETMLDKSDGGTLHKSGLTDVQNKALKHLKELLTEGNSTEDVVENVLHV